MIKYFLSFISCLVCYILYAQEPVTLNLSNKDGVSGIRFYDMLEDTKGFIWLAGDKGLFRYNGKSFKKFDNNTKKGLAVFDLNEDKKGRIWCTNITGQIFYAENDTLVTHSNIGNKINYQLPDILLFKDKLYVFSQYEIFLIDVVSKRITSVFKSNHRIGMAQEIDGKLQFNSGAKIYALEHQKTRVIANHQVLEKKTSEEIRGAILTTDTKHSLLFKCNNEYEIYKLNSQKIEKLVLPPELIETRIVTIHSINNQFWICTNKGVLVYEMNNQRLELKNHYLKNVFVTNILIDKQENYWFSSIGKGLFVIPNINVKRLPILEKYKNITSVSKISNTTILFGTLNGYTVLYNVTTNTSKELLKRNNKKVNIISPVLFQNKVLVGFDDKTLEVDIHTKKTREIRRLIATKSITKKSNDNLIVSTYLNSKIINPNTYNIVTYLGKKRTKTTYFDATENSIYIGAIDGFTKYDSTLKPKEITFKNTPILSTSITQTTDSTLWIGTTKNGLFSIKKDSVTYNLTTKNGLQSNTILNCKSIGNNLWISTDNSFQKVNTKTLDIQTLTQSEGIPPYTITGFVTNKNDIIFTTNNGLYSFGHQSFKEYEKPSLYITDVSVQNKKVTIQNTYELPYTNNHISLQFFSNGFKSEENISYQYQINTKNTKPLWRVLPKGVTSLQFNNLSSGNYNLKIRAKNTKANTFSNEIVTTIKVKTPLWKNAYFILFSILLLTIATIYSIRRRIRLQQEQQELEFERVQQEKQLIAMNLENLRSQMNPHFIFNSLSTIQEYILTNKTDLASDFLVKFSRLIRMYLEHSQVEEISLQQEIETLKIYLSLEKERFGEDLMINFLIDDALKNSSFLVPSIFIQPYVENAIKHGLLHKKENKQLTISFSIKNNFVLCKVEDNGVGRKRAQEIVNKRNYNHKSFATSANQTRLQLINKNKKNSITVEIIDLYEDKMPRGTKVIIKIPVKKQR